MTSRGAEKMNNGNTIGVDVSKDHLDAHRLADGRRHPAFRQLRRGGHKALIKWVAETPLYRVVFEPTGLYHRAVERPRWASLAFRSSRSIRVRRAASLRRPASWRRPITPGCGDPGSHGRLAGIGGAPSPEASFCSRN